MSFCLAVLGMHRSGTSALAGAMAMAGVKFGGKLLPPAEDNPRGFWENEDIVALHEFALARLESSWDAIVPLGIGWQDEPFLTEFRARLRSILARDFSGFPIWGVKDPRLSRLLPLWGNVLDEVGTTSVYVIAVRDPIEVYQSLARRNGTHHFRAALSWLEHTLSAERHTRGCHRHWVRYEDLLTDWRVVLNRIFSMEKISLQISIEDEHRIDQYLERTLRHYQGTDETFGSIPMRLAQDLYTELPRLMAEDQIERGFDAVQKMLCDFWIDSALAIDCLQSETRELRIQNRLLRESIESLEREVLRVKGSFFWKLGMPIRVLQNLVVSPGVTLRRSLRTSGHTRTSIGGAGEGHKDWPPK